MSENNGIPKWTLDCRIALERGGIDEHQASRQQHTAAAILDRLTLRPGLILADEVGMGKTFVALAVAASLAWRANKPAVVMAPVRLIDKWKRDATRFRTLCVVGDSGTEPPPFRVRVAESGAEFLKCFDDPPERSAQLILLANTALHRAERDPWVRLAAMKRAISHSKAGDDLRRVVARHAPSLLWSSELSGLTEINFNQLLNMRIDGWRSYLKEVGKELDDDPVPRPFYDALSGGHLSQIAEALERVPRRNSENMDARLKQARTVVSDSLKEVWRDALHRAKIQSPLLVFDEAHHLKNASTRLASLFQDSEAGDTSVIWDAFDRMLFLTATPFQLGHAELLQILQRFQAVRWSTLDEDDGRKAFDVQLAVLGGALEDAQCQALSLDRLWGALRSSKLGLSTGEELATDRWRELISRPPPETGFADVARQYQQTLSSFKRAEVILQPWVVRHLRDRSLVTEEGPKARRMTITGRGIIDDISSHAGITVTGDQRFPFLLCARVQGLLGSATGRRAYFAEGLASSYGAFTDTSNQGRPTDDPDVELAAEDELGEAGWYVNAVRDLIGKQRSADEHPKIAATVNRATELWLDGQKVLIFAHFRMTVRDLRDALVARIDKEVSRIAASRLGLRGELSRNADDWLRRTGGRLRDPDSPLHQQVCDVLRRWVGEAQMLNEEQRERIVALLVHDLARPSFLARSFPLDRQEVRESLEADRPTVAQARDAANAVAQSLALRREGSRGSYRGRVQAFLRHLAQDLVSAEERDQLLGDLDAASLEPVLHADGGVDEKTRRRRLQGFNSPLQPDILVASEVMAEGLDLHLDCRHVIHHDLSWNPSTLEQRTGRVDRLRCRAETEGESIHVYLPYLEGTADEKMYRVVTDRARWFQVVMGERYRVDEASTEKYTDRVPFPEVAAEELMFDLRVVR